MKKLSKAEREKPTKEELKAAREVMRRYCALRRAKFKKTRKLMQRSPTDREFYTWTHDMRVVLQSAALRLFRTTPEEIALKARDAADAMATLIAQRKPGETGDSIALRGRRKPAMRLWHIWQEMFDTMIHEMAAKSDSEPAYIVERACAIADAAMPHIKRRYKR